MTFADVVPWIAVAISMLALIFGRTDRGADATAQMQVDIGKIKTMLENMQENHGSLEERQKIKDAEQDRIFREHKEHNSARHAEFWGRLETLEGRVTDIEKQS